MTVTVAVILIVIICSFIIVHYLYKIKDDLDEQLKDLRFYQNHIGKSISRIEQSLYQIDDIVSDIEDALNNTEIKNQYNMEEKVYTEKDLVDFGNYLLSEQRNKTIESEEMKSVVGDWDLANWKNKCICKNI